MASIVLTAAGSAIGNSLLPGLGGALLGGLGGALGSRIDNAIFGTTTVVKGARLDSLRIQDSSYGNGIPILYGRNRVAGNVIWASDLHETLSSEESGGKGGGSRTRVERASYSADCAIALGEGPVGAITTIWADSKEIYRDGQWTSGVVGAAEFFTGTATQNPSSIMESTLGGGYVPAYRGLAYVVLEGFQLASFGNRLPNFTFEVLAAAAPPAPAWLGDVQPAVFARPDSFSYPAALAPHILQRQGGTAVRVLAGGMEISGTQYRFCAIEYDVSGDAPVERTRTVSSWFTRSPDTQDMAWAVSPDGRYVAYYAQHYDTGNPVALAVYDTVTRSFGAVLDDGLAAVSSHAQVAWLDSQHLLLPDISGGVLGVRLYAVAGLGVSALGFFPLWGAGSAATRFPLPFAHFGRISGGLVMLAGNHASTPSAIYALTLYLSGATLITSGELTISTGMSAFSATSTHLMQRDSGEFILARSNASTICLTSFLAGHGTVTVTRAWASIALPFSGYVTVNRQDDRVIFVQQPYAAPYGYGEISLSASGFALAQSTTLISGDYEFSSHALGVYALGGRRYLLQVGDSGNGLERIGLFIRAPGTASLGAITADLLARCGYEASDYNVTALDTVPVEGYAADAPLSGRRALEPLQSYYPFDLVESDGVLVARPLTAAADLAIETAETRAAADGSDVPPLAEFTRAQEQDLPATLLVDYIDPDLDFQKGSQRAQRLASASAATEQIRLPVVCSASAAKQIAESSLYRRWLGRVEIRAPLSRRYALLDPGDVITLESTLYRITEVQQAGGLVRVTAQAVSAQVIGSSAVADSGSGVARVSSDIPDTVLYLMDLPPLRAVDDQPGFYIAASGVAGWRGAALYRSADGVNFTQAALFTLPATAGIAATALASAPYAYMDRAHSVTVAALAGSLSSCTETELLNGANAMLLGSEIIQFQTASLNADGSYTLTNLLRGRRGTESAVATHAAGEAFVLLQDARVQFLPLESVERGRSLIFRAASIGQDVDDVPGAAYAPSMRTLQPLAPVHLSGARDGSGNLAVSWIRRARRDAEWMDSIDVPLDEDAESYDVEIMSGSSVVRSFAGLTSPAASYSAAQQVADFGSVQTSVAVKVYQNSARYGRGVALEGNV